MKSPARSIRSKAEGIEGGASIWRADLIGPKKEGRQRTARCKVSPKRTLEWQRTYVPVQANFLMEVKYDRWLPNLHNLYIPTISV